MIKKNLLLISLLSTIWCTGMASIKDTVLIIGTEHYNRNEIIFLWEMDGWLFKAGNNQEWANPDLDTDDWTSLRPVDLTFDHADEKGKIEGWFRTKIKLDSTLEDTPLSWSVSTLGAVDLYIDGRLQHSFGIPNSERSLHKNYMPFRRMPVPEVLNTDKIYNLAFYFVEHDAVRIKKLTGRSSNIIPYVMLSGPTYSKYAFDHFNLGIEYFWMGALVLLTVLFWFLSLLNRGNLLFLQVSGLSTLILIVCWVYNFVRYRYPGLIIHHLCDLIVIVSSFMIVGLIPVIIYQLIHNTNSRVFVALFWLMGILGFVSFFIFETFNLAHVIISGSVLCIAIVHVIRHIRSIKPIQWVMISGVILTILCLIGYVLVTNSSFMAPFQNIIVSGLYLSMPISMMAFFTLQYNFTLKEVRTNTKKIIRLSSEKEKLIESQKSDLEKEVKARTEDLEKSLAELKSTQNQLIQQEKLASLGQLTAGIAHEIKNPLNFVNNFSEVSMEMADEVIAEINQIGENPHVEEARFILEDIKSNLKKIHEHGSRADSIIKSMLQHSRSSSGVKEPVNINALISEYVNLSFHAMRASKTPINVAIDIDLDEQIGKIPLIGEDFSRVILNLCNNAFDAMREKRNQDDTFQPKLSVRSRKLDKQIIIEIEDNGPGVPNEIKNKILQPFFTTKKGTQGTGLGLSITNDIVKAHGGEIDIQSHSGQTIFTIKLRNQ